MVESLTLNIEPKNMDIKKGTYLWDKESIDFLELTTFGQKAPSKKDKWQIEVTIDNEEIVGYCDYDIARIIHILMDRIDEQDIAIQELREE